MKKLLLALGLLVALSSPSFAYVAGFIYVDCDGSTCAGSNGALATNSGGTNTSTPTLTGTAATLVTSTTAVTLDVNTNISTVAGCSGGTCDGSQSIYIVNATNAGRNIFWILSYTGCTGTGACVLTVDTAVTCTTCTAGNWTIGGRYLFPSGATTDKVAAAMRAGDTIQFNVTPSSKSGGFITLPNVAGNTTNGRLNLIGKPGVAGITLATSGSGAIVVAASNGTGMFVGNLTIQDTGSSTNTLVTIASTGGIIQNVKIIGSGASTTQHCVVSAASNLAVIDSELTGCGGSGIVMGSNSSIHVVNSYIHGNGVDGITCSTTSGNCGEIRGNVIAANGGRGINFSGISTVLLPVLIDGNTIYGNTLAGLEVESGTQSVLLRNNIIQSTITGVATVKYDALTAEFVGIHDHNVFWNSVDSNSGLSGMTINATEFASSPLLSAPGSGNFSISNSSPAASVGYLGSLPLAGASTGFRDIGAIQRNATGGGGGGGGHIIGG